MSASFRSKRWGGVSADGVTTVVVPSLSREDIQGVLPIAISASCVCCWYRYIPDVVKTTNLSLIMYLLPAAGVSRCLFSPSSSRSAKLRCDKIDCGWMYICMCIMVYPSIMRRCGWNYRLPCDGSSSRLRLFLVVTHVITPLSFVTTTVMAVPVYVADMPIVWSLLYTEARKLATKCCSCSCYGCCCPPAPQRVRRYCAVQGHGGWGFI